MKNSATTSPLSNSGLPRMTAPTLVDREPAPEVGRVLDDGTELREVIGVGALAVVFRGYQAEAKRWVAVKLARPNPGVELARRLAREAEAGARLDHPNCVTVYGSGTLDGRHYIVMPLLEGRPLSHDLGRPCSVERFLDVASDILQGVAHAHDRGIVHRDLRPENVRVVPADPSEGETTERCVVVDFGLAKFASEEEELATTLAAVICGTPGYMSPELALGVPTDDRTDIYSLGVLFYTLLTGRPPFRSVDPERLIRQHMCEDVPALPVTVPAALAGLVQWMLQRKRGRRCPRAADALALLRAFAAVRSPAASGVVAPDDVADPPRCSAVLQRVPAAVGLEPSPGLPGSTIRLARPLRGPSPPAGRPRTGRRPSFRLALGLSLLTVVAAAAWTIHEDPQARSEVLASPPGRWVAQAGLFDTPGRAARPMRAALAHLGAAPLLTDASDDAPIPRPPTPDDVASPP